MSNKEQSFEEALAKLEKIVSEMEAGELSLEKMMKKYEEGSKLAQICTKKLTEVEQKIDQLVKKNDQLDTEPLDKVEP